MSEMENSWVLFQIQGQNYGIRTEFIREMVLLTPPVEVPEVPDYVRGVINLRGSVLPVIDLRKRLGRQSREEQNQELISLLRLRKQDHINWLQELKDSTEENREFKLTTDPHACAFGKWYDNFKSDDVIMNMQLKKFDAPHQKIHSIAIEVEKLKKTDRADEALQLIEGTWNRELADMINFFDETEEALLHSNKEIVIIIEQSGLCAGLVVDGVSEVTDISPDDIQPPPAITKSHGADVIDGIAKVEDEVKILLDTKKLLNVEQLGGLTQTAEEEVEPADA